MDGTWLPMRPGSDTALAMAIAYVWLTEGTYDKQYIAEKTYGFDEFKAYILGEVDDKFAKTPEWAEKESGIPARKIRSLAREWASKRTIRELRQPRRRRQRLPYRLWHRVGAHDGALTGHAGAGQARNQHLGHHHGGSGQSRHLVPGLCRAARADGQSADRQATAGDGNKTKQGSSALPFPRPFSPARKISGATASAADTGAAVHS